MSEQARKQRRGGVWRWCRRWALRVAAGAALVLAAAFVIVCRAALYERFYLFPRQARALADLRSQRITPAAVGDWQDYRGVLHAHSELSHDSAVTQAEALRAAAAADVDFFCMTDHYVDGRADYSLGWNGPVGGVLFIRGYELNDGFLAWGVPTGTVFQATDEPRALARRIHEMGAVLFLAHCEKERLWDLPELDGIEIYNLHADFQDEDMRTLIPRLLLCLHPYPEQTMRTIFAPPRPLLARWDALNRDRHLTGIAGNDAHQNVGIRAVVSGRGTLVLSNTGEKRSILREVQLNRLVRLLLRPLTGPLEPGREVFRVELDPYARSCRFVNTHVLARACTEEGILEALRAGRAYVAFSMLADARGFTCRIAGAARTAVLGEGLPFEPGLRLQAAAPLPCRFLVYRDGVCLHREEGREVSLTVDQPGHYRVQAELGVLDAWVPWIYANPITVQPPAAPSGRRP